MRETKKNIKQTKFGQWFKKTRFCDFLKQSQGDWRYPFMILAWSLSKFIVPRRKVSINNIFFTLPCHNWITHFRWYLFKKKEEEVRYYIDHYVKEGDTFFDIGANIGVFSVYTAKRFSNISCYCFEPEYSNLNILKENVVANKIIDKVTIYSVAIGNFVGLSRLNLQDLTSGSAAHTESKAAIKTTEEGYPVVWSEGIVSVTLDYVCQEAGIVPNAIKIDTDGNEDKVLQGAVKTLGDERLRSLVIEMPDDKEKELACRQMLAAAKFDLEWSRAEKTRNQIWIKRKG